MNTRRFNGRERGSKNFKNWQKDILLEWLRENRDNMYPTEAEKSRIAALLEVDKSKVSNWFINMRKRYFQHDVKVQINKYRYKPKLQSIKRMKVMETQAKYEEKNGYTASKENDLFSSWFNKYCFCDANKAENSLSNCNDNTNAQLNLPLKEVYQINCFNDCLKINSFQPIDLLYISECCSFQEYYYEPVEVISLDGYCQCNLPLVTLNQIDQTETKRLGNSSCALMTNL